MTRRFASGRRVGGVRPAICDSLLCHSNNVAERIVERVRVLIKTLRINQIWICYVDASEATLHRSVISRAEVIEARLIVVFFLG